MINHIKRITVQGKITSRLKKTELEFLPGINLLIGPNGSGKSTIFELIKSKPKRFKGSKIKVTYEGNGAWTGFDFEKQNPRTSGHVESMLDVMVRRCSHGEVTKSIINGFKNNDVNNLIALMDEPEQALDLDGLKLLIEVLKETPASQVILITHSPYLIMQNDFHIVEMVDGYRDRVINEMKSLIS